tara:strand:+ start:574 stop:2460 length:1887 start_codon:yes stop_codon:yes gene_type:complete
MGKKIWILLLVFMVVVQVSFSANLTVYETDVVNLVPKAYDPDNDSLNYSYSYPLDENGKWQTDYGDAGQYSITVTASDGESFATKDVLLIVNKKEAPPVIDSFKPDAYELSYDEGEKIDFSVSASDLNKDELSYMWELDGETVSSEGDYTYAVDFEQEGNHSMIVYVSDGRSIASQEWFIFIKNVNRVELLKQIKDVSVDETGVAKLDLPDFSAYNLEHNISEPVGNDGEWVTGYDDAGEYTVKIMVKDKKFEASKEVTITVNNVDRKPELEPVGIVLLKENQKVTINLSAVDADGDAVSYSAEGIPEGASLNGNSFTWSPGYDAIKREGFWNLLLDKYHLLSKSYSIKFIAVSNELSDEKTVTIIVSDVNRKPELVSMGDIIVNEGESVIIRAEANDPDGDDMKFSYSGWMNSDRKTTTYGDAGIHTVRVSVSDGWLIDYKDVKIIVRKVNRDPKFLAIEDGKVSENQTIEIVLKASDPDGDKLTYSVSNLTGAYISDNVFKWRPSFDFVDSGEEAYANVVFTVSDGSSEAEQDAIIFVDNTNRKPELKSKSLVETVNVGKPVIFEVDAVDADDDKLQYVWKFGFFDKFEGKNIIKRVFTSSGNKKVEIIVSDGLASVSYKWNVKVT